jgi:hypothetical protein
MKKDVQEQLLVTLQDVLIFQMATKGVPQSQIREAVGVDANRVGRLAKLAKKSGKAEE